MNTPQLRSILCLGVVAMFVGCGTSHAPEGDAQVVALPGDAVSLKACVADGAVVAPDPGLPTVSSGPRPGPDLLYAPANTPAIVLNHDPRFRAAPLMVQGAEAYIDGEYLYQDYIYDDYGSDVSNDDLNEVPVTVGNSDLNGLEPRVGDIDYPTNFARYGGNAADLVEFRISQNVSEVSYRITLNTLLEADTTIIAIVFDMDRNPLTGTTTLSRDPGAPFPGTDEVIYLWGTGAEHVSSNGVTSTATPLVISTRLDANQMWVTVPRSLHNPSGDVPMTVAVGLHDTSNGGWLLPLTSAPTETQPGAVKDANFDPNPAGIFNLAFRFDEPAGFQNTPPDTFQSERIRAKTPTVYQHTISFDDLVAGVNRDTIPATGTQNRIYASSFSVNRDGTRSLDGSAEGRDLAAEPDYLGVLQPYAIYVPTAAASGQPLAMNWAFHSNAQEHWQYNGSTYVQQIGEALDALVPTPLGRSPTNWYDNEAEADVFEVWADILRNFNVDSKRVSSTGYSMGGYATYRLPALYPDLFAKAFSQVGPPGEAIWVPPNEPTGGATTLTNRLLENLRNIPYMNIAALQDELVPYSGTSAQNLGNPGFGIQGFADRDYRFRFLTFSTAEHYTLFLVDNYPMAEAFLEGAVLDRNPYHVTFSYLPAEDNADYDLIHDHAYWVSDLRLADASDELSKGTIDAFSHACGKGVPVGIVGADAGNNPLSYSEINNSWGAPPIIDAENRLSLTLSNLAAVSLDLDRAGLDSSQPIIIDLDSDSSGLLTLSHGGVVTRLAYGSGAQSLALP